MSVPPDRRTRKRLATRQGISNAATRLFLERGFDAVTVDEIAEAADVGRMASCASCAPLLLVANLRGLL